MATSDESLYLQAMQEVESGARHEALWAKALTLEKGNEKQAKYTYIQFRVEQLLSANEMPQEVSGLPVTFPPSPYSELGDVNDPQRSDGYSFPTHSEVLVKWTLFALWVLAAMAFLSVVVYLMQFDLLVKIETITTEAAEANDTRIGYVNRAELVAFLISSIIVWYWIYQTNKNCHGYGTQGMRFTPVWAVAWSFVPVMNLYRPYQVMQEIWKICSDPGSWKKQPSSLLIKWWWFFSLLFSFLGGVLLKASLRNILESQSIDQLKNLTSITIAFDCALFMSTITTIWMIKAIREKQISLSPQKPSAD